MKKNNKLNQQKSEYDQRQKDKGLIKACYWHSPVDSDHMSNQARLSRKRHDKRPK